MRPECDASTRKPKRNDRAGGRREAGKETNDRAKTSGLVAREVITNGAGLTELSPAA